MKRRTFLGTLAATLAGLLGGRAKAQGPDQPPSPARQDRELAMKLAARFPYEHLIVPGASALATWERLRSRGDGWPVVIGGDEDFNRAAEQFSIDDPAAFPQHPFLPGPPLRTPAEIIAAADAIRLPGALEKHWRDEYGNGEEPRSPEIGDWPSSPEGIQPGLTVASDFTGRPVERVHIVVLPTRVSAEVPAYLRWGGWNACPPPEVHVAVLRDWHRRYGTELVGISGDVLNLRAPRRPASRDEALALAREHYLYCSDIVDQGTGTLAPLAADLMASEWWFFWWD